jgi:hypothetical protein
MRIVSKSILLIAFSLPFAFAKAQFNYSIDQSIPVEANGKNLTMPWAGGLNAAQINTMDLNDDGKPDLVIFDRTARKVITFLNQNNQYVYSPDYESFFPAEIGAWLLLRDFNCDGKKDIFTSDPFGVKVFVNTTQSDKISWRQYNPGSPLLTRGFSSNINLKVNTDDVPAIDDIDGDGDLDFLNVRFVGIGTIEWHKNLSVERTGRCDSMQLERITQTWGEFEECECGKISFAGGKTCTQILTGGRTEHTGGKALLSMDFDNNGVRDLFFTEEECANLYLLSNQGTATNALMNSFDAFPTGAPLSMPFFPAPYSEDVDFDGLPDLIVSPNISSHESFSIDFQKSLSFFKNTGTKQLPKFTFQKANFLQNEMIDMGDFSVPAFFDFDGDGDQDLFISYYAKTASSGSVAQFENVGTNQTPAFKLLTDDFFFLSSLNKYNFKIQFADMNGDTKVDLAFTSSLRRNGATELVYLANSSSDKFVVTDPLLKEINFSISFNSNWIVIDVNQDGLNDILVGEDTGGIEYWKNDGPAEANNYSLANPTFLGLGSSTERQNPSMAAADLDTDGREELIVGNQRGELSIYGDFRAQNETLIGANEIILNNVTQNYEIRDLGGRVWPTTVNLFNTNKPVIVVGNTMGGLQILKNSEGKELPEQPDISIYPNPYTYSDVNLLKIRADRNVLVQFYNLLGQKISGSYFIPANQEYSINAGRLPAGMYIAQFSWKGKTFGKRFVVY